MGLIDVHFSNFVDSKFLAEISFVNFSKICKKKICSWMNIEILQDFSNGYILIAAVEN